MPGRSRLEAIASRVEAMAPRLEAIAGRLEAIAGRLEAIAGRLEAIAGRESIAGRSLVSMQKFCQERHVVFFEGHRVGHDAWQCYALED